MQKYKHYIVFLAKILVIYSCSTKNEAIYHEDTGKIFNTTYSIKYKYSTSLKDEIEKSLQTFDNSLNPFKESSIISKINRNEDVELDSLFINVISRAQEVSELSDGLFDITLAPLINAWGFGFKNMDKIDKTVLDSLKSFVGYDKIRLENNQVIKTDPRVNINASAIAKGYSVDVIALLLDSHDIEDYVVEIGGEIRTKGVNAKNRCWRITVTKPMKKNDYAYSQNNTQALLSLCNKSLATSGDYYKYYIKEGKKYSHTINPRTCYPSENSILSATVIADDCMSADAFATVFMLADTAIIRQIALDENLSYMLILDSDDSEDFTIVQSENFNSYLIR